MQKVAEPPPPKGVSVKAWDKILQRGPKEAAIVKESSVDVGRIRKLAEQEKNARAFQELTQEPGPTEYDLLYETKIASVVDTELLMTTSKMSNGVEEALTLYERLGGTYSPPGVE